MSKKSILEQALLQIETLEEAVKANAKGILSSTMKNELNGLLEQLEEPEEEETTENVTVPEENVNDVAEQTADEEENELDNEQPEEEGDSDEEGLEDEGMESDEEGLENVDGDEEEGLEDMDTEFEPETEEEPEEEPVLDMTGASDGEVLRVFKAMKEDDGIVVKKDGNTIELKDGDNDYVIKLDNLTESMFDEFKNEYDEEDEFNFPEEEEEDDIYEIVLDDDFEEEGEMEEYSDMPEEEFSEAARTKWNPHGNKTPGVKRSGLPSKKIFKAGSGQINEEVQKLKKQNAEYKKALGLFKEKLNEIAVFNANLAFATRLFTEHTTTKKEKLDILKRFDNASTITESKNLYNSINSELSNKKPMTESVVEKIVSSPKSSSTEILSESKAYENPQFARMRDLMTKIK